MLPLAVVKQSTVVFPFMKVLKCHVMLTLAMYNVIHGLGVPYDVMCSSGHISVHLWLLKTWLSGYKMADIMFALACLSFKISMPFVPVHT